MNTTSRIQGIDVSHFQDRVDWQAVKAAGMVFAFAKATQGVSYVDTLFDRNWRGMKQTGIIRGAYHFFDFTADASTQAAHYLNCVTPSLGDLPPVLDIEYLPKRGDLNTRIRDIKIWLLQVEQGCGRQPIIYTNPSFWRDYMGNTRDFCDYPLWIANYGVSTPHLPGAWTSWLFWQASENGRVEGIDVPVDLDYFNGDLEALQALVNTRSLVKSPQSQSSSIDNQIYIVQSGDSLSKIAEQFGVTVYALAEANDIDNINLIQPGQRLIIP